jgi:hypothetical protein
VTPTATTAHEVATALGIPTTTEPRGRATAWSGTALHLVESAGHPFREEDLYHEIAHWMLSEPDHRRYVGFGLGSSFDATAWHNDGPKLTGVHEEHEASALGIMLHAVAELRKWGRMVETWGHYTSHNWTDTEPSAIFESLDDPRVALALDAARQVGVGWTDSEAAQVLEFLVDLDQRAPAGWDGEE